MGEESRWFRAPSTRDRGVEIGSRLPASHARPGAIHKDWTEYEYEVLDSAPLNWPQIHLPVARQAVSVNLEGTGRRLLLEARASRHSCRFRFGALHSGAKRRSQRAGTDRQPQTSIPMLTMEQLIHPPRIILLQSSQEVEPPSEPSDPPLSIGDARSAAPDSSSSRRGRKDDFSGRMFIDAHGPAFMGRVFFVSDESGKSIISMTETKRVDAIMAAALTRIYADAVGRLPGWVNWALQVLVVAAMSITVRKSMCQLHPCPASLNASAVSAIDSSLFYCSLPAVPSHHPLSLPAASCKRSCRRLVLSPPPFPPRPTPPLAIASSSPGKAQVRARGQREGEGVLTSSKALTACCRGCPLSLTPRARARAEGNPGPLLPCCPAAMLPCCHAALLPCCPVNLLLLVDRLHQVLRPLAAPWVRVTARSSGQCTHTLAPPSMLVALHCPITHKHARCSSMHPCNGSHIQSGLLPVVRVFHPPTHPHSLSPPSLPSSFLASPLPSHQSDTCMSFALPGSLLPP